MKKKKVASGPLLLYRPATLHRLAVVVPARQATSAAGPARQPYAEDSYIPHSWTMNLATGLHPF
jgi:hypothetical protein